MTKRGMAAVDGDRGYRSFFDSMNYEVLMALLAKKIADKMILALIKEMLKAGYLEYCTFHGTYSGSRKGASATNSFQHLPP